MALLVKTRDLLWLTPDLLSELVLTARVLGACKIEVKEETDMMGLAAYIYHDGDWDFKGRTVNGNTISLSSTIDVEKFHAELRPEMNFGEIPRDHIYRFVVYHEVGHALLDPKKKAIWTARGTVDDEKTQMLKLACELRADRYAWSSLFPSRPLPREKGRESMVGRLEDFMRENKELF